MKCGGGELPWFSFNFIDCLAAIPNVINEALVAFAVCGSVRDKQFNESHCHVYTSQLFECFHQPLPYSTQRIYFMMLMEISYTPQLFMTRLIRVLLNWDAHLIAQ